MIIGSEPHKTEQSESARDQALTEPQFQQQPSSVFADMTRNVIVSAPASLPHPAYLAKADAVHLFTSIMMSPSNKRTWRPCTIRKDIDAILKLRYAARRYAYLPPHKQTPGGPLVVYRVPYRSVRTVLRRYGLVMEPLPYDFIITGHPHYPAGFFIGHDDEPPQPELVV